MYKVLRAMYANELEGVECASYQLKDMANVWYTQWEGSRCMDVEPASLEEFETAYLDHFFPQELREARADSSKSKTGRDDREEV